ncbi:MAG: hypothetical protein QXE92_02605 [Thermofilaceae archaeon]
MKNRPNKTIKSTINRLIDTVLHPHFDNPAAVVIDGALHFLVEMNPKESARKFVQFNLPPLLKSLRKWRC